MGLHTLVVVAVVVVSQLLVVVVPQLLERLLDCCKLGLQQWGVTYTPDSVCALEGSSVDLSCFYKYPEGLRVTESLWFINEQRGVGPVDLREDDQYKGRVQYYQNQNQNQLYHTVRITGLRARDAQTYKFRFITDDPGGKFIGRSGVSLSVTGSSGLKIDTGRGGKQLICSSTCTLTNPTYIWYRNEQPVSEQNRAVLDLRDRTVDAGSYSCAVKEHEEIRSAAVCVFESLQVKVEGAAAAPAEGQTVTLTCSSTCSSQSYSNYIWYRNRQPVSECRSASCSVAVFRGEISYSCAVEGRDLHYATVYSPKDTRAVVLPSRERAEGDSVTLTCSSDADPPVLTFSWFKQRPAANKTLGTGQNYSITNISSQHSGLYYCTALNQLGQHSSAPARLDVFSDWWKQYTGWAAVGLVSALALSLLTVILCIQRKRRAERGADVQPGDDTYTALNLATTSSSEYDTLTVVGPPPVQSGAPDEENN
ncbi:hypothetical protein AMEX_G14750 [Astyanax mexicanus]|uniref:Ig-like domain-containing protein n=1 Tax=Astyanax mexicanus TaxID=7994 RepID=A0A8T2LI78_ASTMX|nr:hypothetical protein AMEX_G14750 [Astyanax mexicanus]